MTTLRSLRGRAAALLTLATSSVGCDQYSKGVATEALRGSSPVDLLGGFLRFVYAENRGGFLSLGADLGDDLRAALFISGVAIALLGLVAYLLFDRRVSELALVGGALVLAGGIGNLIDRVVGGGVVVDFVRLSAGRLSTGIFNLADVQIMLGAALMVWAAPVTRKPATDPGEAAE